MLSQKKQESALKRADSIENIAWSGKTRKGDVAGR